MLGDKKVWASMPVVDIERAKKFYTEKLGLAINIADDNQMMLTAGGDTGIYLYKREATKADHTVAGWIVDDIETEVEELKNKGVVFEEYDMPEMGIKTENGIATMAGMKSAWFKDTEGNILSIGEMTK